MQLILLTVWFLRPMRYTEWAIRPIVDILNLSKFNILNVAENEHDFQIRVEADSPPLTCPHCGCIANLYKHDNREQLCMDLPIHGKRVGLLIKRQRYRCRDCKQTFWERLDHTINEKRSCTNRYYRTLKSRASSVHSQVFRKM